MEEYFFHQDEFDLIGQSYSLIQMFKGWTGLHPGTGVERQKQRKIL